MRKRLTDPTDLGTFVVDRSSHQPPGPPKAAAIERAVLVVCSVLLIQVIAALIAWYLGP